MPVFIRDPRSWSRVVPDIAKPRIRRPLLLLGLLLAILLPSFGGAAAPKPGAGKAAQFFPLSLGKSWVLRDPVYQYPYVFTVVAAAAPNYRIRSVTPWGSTDYQLSDQGDKYAMTAYGSAQGMAPVSNTVYLDFSVPAGTSWTTILGTMTVQTTGASVTTGGVTYPNCTRISQVGGSGTLVMTLAAGVGVIEYSVGGMPFLLDPATSTLPATFSASSSSARVSPSLPPVGVVPNGFANQTDSLQASIDRMQLLAAGGANFLVGYGRWTELEPSQGTFTLDSLKLLTGESRVLNAPVSYTFCAIDMAARNVPPELQNVAWSDPKMQARVFAIIDRLASQFAGRVKWLQFGNEVDTYFYNHPAEIEDFTILFSAVKAHLATVAPGVKLSVTFKLSALPQLGGYFSRLNSLSDLLVFTIGPYNADYTVEDPAVVHVYFLAMEMAAGQRQLLVQELAYPSAAANNSSQSMQAQFVQNVFTELRAAPNAFAGASFYPLADCSPQQAQHWTEMTGMTSVPLFPSLVQTLGLFDGLGQPKSAWNAFVAQSRQ